MSVELHKLTEAQRKLLRSACNPEYHATFHGGERNKFDIRGATIHCTWGENPKETAKDNARYFAGASARGSAQLVTDDKECYRCVPDLVVPYGAPPLNYNHLHYEQVGQGDWTRAQWMEHWFTIRWTAYKIAVAAHNYNFPPIWLPYTELRRGNWRGVTSHLQVSIAFGQTNHEDPGPPDGKHYPYDYFMAALVHHYKEGHH
jgi:hypothetical protein